MHFTEAIFVGSLPELLPPPSVDYMAYDTPDSGEDSRYTRPMSNMERPLAAEPTQSAPVFATTFFQPRGNRDIDHTGVERSFLPEEGSEVSSETATFRSAEFSSPAHKTESRKSNPKGWWWWWEIGASLLSIITIGLVVPVLKTIDNKPLDAWTYSIRPNSLISILTTISKSAMTALTASCLGQLKWDHFQYSPNPLDHLQIYDVSRIC